MPKRNAKTAEIIPDVPIPINAIFLLILCSIYSLLYFAEILCVLRGFGDD